jgi:hypothetical protein
VRKSLVCLLVGAQALGVAVTAFSSPQFAATFAFTYSAKAPDSPSGADGLATWSDPGEPSGKPKELQRIKLLFHHGARLDTSALPVCKASDGKIQRLGVRACPASTRLGTVKAEGIISVGQRFNPIGNLFNAKRQIIVVVTVDGRTLIYFRDDVRRSSITINLKIPSGIALTRFQPHVPRHVRKRDGKTRAYLRTPPVCPPGGFWTTTAIFSYRDGSAQRLSALTPCKS